MLEKRIESAFVKATQQRGGLCLKFTSPSMTGVPDRLVLLPEGHMGFVEMKAPVNTLAHCKYKGLAN